jgi:3-hydroxybutyryl-CoA dehydratase
METGDRLPELVKEISQESMNAYAEATNDFNPIHIDEAFAKETPFKGTIAHGFYIFAFVSELMTRHFGKRWTNGGHVDVRFLKPVRPGDTITVKATVSGQEMKEGRSFLVLSVVWENQLKEPVIAGQAFV